MIPEGASGVIADPPSRRVAGAVADVAATAGLGDGVNDPGRRDGVHEGRLPTPHCRRRKGGNDR